MDENTRRLIRQQKSRPTSADDRGPHPEEDGDEYLSIPRVGTVLPEGKSPGDTLADALAMMGIAVRRNGVSGEQEWRGLISGVHPEVKTAEWRPADRAAVNSLRAELGYRFQVHVEGDEGKIRPYVFSGPKWEQAADQAADLNVQHPPADYFRRLREGKRRTDPGEYLVKLFGAHDSPMNRWAFCSILGGVVMRTYEPGCALRQLVILVGPQSCGKSLLIRKLLPPRLAQHVNTDFIFGDDPKAMVDSILGIVLAEAAECSGLRPSKVEAIKAFVSNGRDTVRLAYERRAADIPRTVNIVGTANDGGGGLLAPDASGNTRFIPVPVRPPIADGVSAAVTALLAKTWPAVRDSLWRDVVARYDAGERWHSLPASMAAYQEKVTSQFTAPDDNEAWTAWADKAFVGATPHQWYRSSHLVDLAETDPEEAQKIKLRLAGRGDQTRFGKALRLAGFDHRKDGRGAMYRRIQ